MIKNIEKYGRVHETGLFLTFARKAGGLPKLLKEIPFGLSLFRKGKLKLSAEKIAAKDQLLSIFRAVEELEEGDK